MTGFNSSAIGPRQFKTTRWSLVLAAGGENAEAVEALGELAQSYWYPLYCYLRRRGCDREESRDVTQGFFAKLLEEHGLRHLVPEGGRFRSYLLTSLKHFLINERQRANALKRGGNAHVVSIETENAEAQFSREPFHESTPEAAYEKLWARSVLQKAVDRLQRCYQNDETGRYAVLKDHLVDASKSPHAALAEQLGLSEGAVKVALHRMRKRFAQCLREVVADTVAGTDEVEDELQHLMDALK